jgi:hypothetical protein
MHSSVPSLRPHRRSNLLWRPNHLDLGYIWIKNILQGSRDNKNYIPRLGSTLNAVNSLYNGNKFKQGVKKGSEELIWNASPGSTLWYATQGGRGQLRMGDLQLSS